MLGLDRVSRKVTERQRVHLFGRLTTSAFGFKPTLSEVIRQRFTENTSATIVRADIEYF
tara:strand:+ start:80 stop:256 length:177 start_codon:yes stop_codon:yes gene_type:complete